MKRSSRTFLSLLLVLSLCLGMMPMSIFADEGTELPEPAAAENVLEANVDAEDDVAAPEEAEEPAAGPEELTKAAPVEDPEALVKAAPVNMPEAAVKASPADDPDALQKAGPADGLSTDVFPGTDIVLTDATNGDGNNDGGDGDGDDPQAKPTSVWVDIDYKKTVTYNGEEQTFKPETETEVVPKVLFYDNSELDGTPLENSDVLAAYVGEIQISWGTEDEDKQIIRGTNAGQYGVKAFAQVDLDGLEAIGYEVKGLDEDVARREAFLVIEKKPVNVILTGGSAEEVFNGKGHSFPKVEISIEEEEPCLFDKKEDIWFNSKVKPPVNVGEYKNAPSVEVSSNFKINSCECTPSTLTITPAPITIKTGSIRKMYDENDPSTATLEYPKWEIVDGTFFNKDGIKEVPVNGKAVWEGKTVTVPNTYDKEKGVVLTDSCYIHLDAIGKESVTVCNYDVKVVLGELTIYSPKDVLVQIYGETDKVPYNGEQQSLKGIARIDIDNENYLKEYKEDPSIISIPNIAATGKDVGEYKMGLKAELFENKLEDYNVTFEVVEDGRLLISPVPVYVVVKANQADIMYDGKEHSMPVYVIEAIKQDPQYSAPLFDNSKINYKSEPTLKRTVRGTSIATVAKENFSSSDSNYKVAFDMASGNETEDATLRVYAPKVEVTVKGTRFEVPYTGEEQTLSFENGKAVVNGEVSDEPLFEVKSAVTRDEEGNAIDFDFDESDLYFRSNLQSVSGTDIGFYNVPNWANYLTYKDQNFDVIFYKEDDIGLGIRGEQLTLVIDDKEMTYGDPMPELTAHFEGLPEGATAPEYELYVTDKVFAIDTTQGNLDAREYRIFSYAIEGYEVNIRAGKLTINPRPVTAKVTGDKIIKPYNGTEQTATVKYTLTSEDQLFQAYYNAKISKEALNPFQMSRVVKGTEIGTYKFDLENNEIAKLDLSKNYSVTYDIDDGYLKIIDASDVELADITFKFNGGEYTFDGKSHTADVTVTAPEGYTVIQQTAYYKNGRMIKGLPVNAGTYDIDLFLYTIIDAEGNDITALYTADSSHISVEYGEYNTITINPLEIEVSVTGNKKTVSTETGRFGWIVEGYTIETDYGDAEIDDAYAYSAEHVLYDTDNDGEDDAVVDYTKGEKPDSYPWIGYMNLKLEKFQNQNDNYTVTFTSVEDGWLKIVDDSTVDIPELKLYFKSEDEFTAGNTGFGEYNITETYDGTAKTFILNFAGQEKELTEEDISNGNTERRFVLSNETGEKYTFVVKLPENAQMLKRTDAGEAKITLNDYIKNNWLVYAEDGSDVTGMAGQPKYVKYVNLKVNPVELKITINTELKKNYGDPDPDINTWFTAECEATGETFTLGDLQYGFEHLSGFVIERAPGEEAFTTKVDETTGKVLERTQPGYYKIYIHWAIDAQAATDDPEYPWDDEERNDRKKAVRSVKAVMAEAEQESISHEQEVAQASEVLNPIFNQKVRDIWNYQLTLTNEEPAYLEIDPLPLTITARSYEKDYQTNDPTPFEADVVGLLPGEFIPEGSYTVGPRDKGEAPGTYNIPVTTRFDEDNLFGYDTIANGNSTADDEQPAVKQEVKVSDAVQEAQYKSIAQEYVVEALRESASRSEKTVDAVERVNAEVRPNISELTDVITTEVMTLTEEEQGGNGASESETPAPDPGENPEPAVVAGPDVVQQYSSGVFLPKNYKIITADGELVITATVLYHSNYNVEGVEEKTYPAEKPEVVTTKDYTAIGVAEAGFAGEDGIWTDPNGKKHEFVCWTDADGVELGTKFTFGDNGVQAANSNEDAQTGVVGTSSRMTLASIASSSADGSPDLELYAKWKDVYTVTWVDEDKTPFKDSYPDDDNDKNDKGYPGTTYKDGEAQPADDLYGPAPDKDGKVFDHWDKQGGENGTGDITYVAVYKDVYNVIWVDEDKTPFKDSYPNDDNNKNDKGYPGTTYKDGEAQPADDLYGPAPDKDGKVFDHWDKQGGENGTGDITYVAVYKDVYNVIWVDEDGKTPFGDSYPNDDNNKNDKGYPGTTYKDGEAQPADDLYGPAPDKDGKAFDHWDKKGGENGTGDITYVAVYKDLHTATWVDEDGETELNKETFKDGEDAPKADTYTAPEKEGKTFDHWEEEKVKDDAGNETGDVIYTAVYKDAPANNQTTPSNPRPTTPAATEDPTEEEPTIDDGETPLSGFEVDPEEDEPVAENDTPLAGYEEEPDEELSDEAMPFSPFTGDARHTAVWSIISVLSLLGIVLVARKRREE